MTSYCFSRSYCCTVRSVRLFHFLYQHFSFIFFQNLTWVRYFLKTVWNDYRYLPLDDSPGKLLDKLCNETFKYRASVVLYVELQNDNPSSTEYLLQVINFLGIPVMAYMGESSSPVKVCLPNESEISKYFCVNTYVVFNVVVLRLTTNCLAWRQTHTNYFQTGEILRACWLIGLTWFNNSSGKKTEFSTSTSSK